MNAAWNRQDFTLLLLAACAKYGTAPDTDWDVEMTPVDFAAQVIVKLVQHPDSAIGKTLHVINDKPLPAKYVRGDYCRGDNGVGRKYCSGGEKKLLWRKYHSRRKKILHGKNTVGRKYCSGKKILLWKKYCREKENTVVGRKYCSGKKILPWKKILQGERKYCRGKIL